METNIALAVFGIGFLIGGFVVGTVGYVLGDRKARNVCREILRECEQDAALLRHIERYS